MFHQKHNTAAEQQAAADLAQNQAAANWAAQNQAGASLAQNQNAANWAAQNQTFARQNQASGFTTSTTTTGAFPGAIAPAPSEVIVQPPPASTAAPIKGTTQVVQGAPVRGTTETLPAIHNPVITEKPVIEQVQVPIQKEIHEVVVEKRVNQPVLNEKIVEVPVVQTKVQPVVQEVQKPRVKEAVVIEKEPKITQTLVEDPSLHGARANAAPAGLNAGAPAAAAGAAPLSSKQKEASLLQREARAVSSH